MILRRVLCYFGSIQDKLFTLEEEMGHYYKYSRRRLQGPPATECIYAAELNKEWLRVMVDEVHDDVSMINVKLNM